MEPTTAKMTSTKDKLSAPFQLPSHNSESEGIKASYHCPGCGLHTTTLTLSSHSDFPPCRQNDSKQDDTTNEYLPDAVDQTSGANSCSETGSLVDSRMPSSSSPTSIKQSHTNMSPQMRRRAFTAVIGTPVERELYPKPLSPLLFSPLMDPLTNSRLCLAEQETANAKVPTSIEGDNTTTLEDQDYLVASYERELDRLLTDISSLKRMIEMEDNRMEELLVEKSKLQETVASQTTQLNDIKTLLQAEKSKLQETVANQAKKLIDMKTLHATVASQATKLIDMKTLQETVASQTTKLNDVKTLLQVETSKLNISTQTVLKLQQKTKTLREENVALRNAMERDTTNFNTETHHLQLENSNLRKRSELYQAKYAQEKETSESRARQNAHTSTSLEATIIKWEAIADRRHLLINLLLAVVIGFVVQGIAAFCYFLYLYYTALSICHLLWSLRTMWWTRILTPLLAMFVQFGIELSLRPARILATLNSTKLNKDNNVSSARLGVELWTTNLWGKAREPDNANASGEQEQAAH